MFLNLISKRELKVISNNMPKKYMRTNLGLIIYELRNSQKIPTHVLCENVDITQPTLYAYINDMANPSLHVFIKLIDALNCEIQIVSKDDPDKKTTLKFR